MSERGRRREQPGPIRLLHWANAILLAILAGSGLQILLAYPAMGPQGAQYRWYPFTGTPPPGWMRIGRWLAGGRHWHFAFAWFFVAVAVAYLAYLIASGEWRRRLFLPLRDARSAIVTARSYLLFRNPPPREGELYNGLQRLAYTSTLVFGVIEVLTGLALYKPVQLRPLVSLFGGYDPARALHWIGLVFFGAFTVGHVIMVAAHPRSFLAMITGGRRDG